MKLYIAPVQGHTDAAWRHYHNECYGGNHLYFTPFLRCERGEMRQKDIRDVISPLNKDILLEPQVIFRDMTELDILLNAISSTDFRNVNLNMGCPFPLQTGKGRGAGFLANEAEASKIPDVLSKYPDFRFSVKMRLGYENPEEWRNIIGILNSIELTNIYVHPRVAKQQYGGDLHLQQFADILDESKNPVVFNGDIKTPEDIELIIQQFPKTAGVMTARGILGRPSLAFEYENGLQLSGGERIERMMEFHKKLLDYYTETLCGESQILSKIKPFWEYAEEEIGRKAWKAIRKASNIAKYHTAVALINNA